MPIDDETAFLERTTTMASKAKISDWIIFGIFIIFFYGAATSFIELKHHSVFTFLAFLICCAVYFAPSLIASTNGKKDATAIIALNFLLGWTFIGWVAALVWALMKD